MENRSLRNAFSAVTHEAVRLLARQLAAGLDDLVFDAAADDSTAPYRIHGRFHGVVGVSPALATVLRACERIVSADPLPCLLISGETGVGKSLLARSLQSISPRADQPFVRESAASVDEAVFERAAGGTLLLDEVTAAPAEVQGRLARLLERHEVHNRRSRRDWGHDVWTLATTNVDLDEACRDGALRPDLYHRLAEHHLVIPPLRARPEDVEPLARHFVAEACNGGRRPPVIGPDLLFYLRTRSWPGNVRELRNTVQSLVRLTDHAVLTLDDLRRCQLNEILVDSTADLDMHEAVLRCRRQVLLAAREVCGGDTKAMAREMNIGRSRVYHWLRVCGVDPKQEGYWDDGAYDTEDCNPATLYTTACSCGPW